MDIPRHDINMTRHDRGNSNPLSTFVGHIKVDCNQIITGNGYGIHYQKHCKAIWNDPSSISHLIISDISEIVDQLRAKALISQDEILKEDLERFLMSCESTDNIDIETLELIAANKNQSRNGIMLELQRLVLIYRISQLVLWEIQIEDLLTSKVCEHVIRYSEIEYGWLYIIQNMKALVEPKNYTRIVLMIAKSFFEGPSWVKTLQSKWNRHWKSLNIVLGITSPLLLTWDLISKSPIRYPISMLLAFLILTSTPVIIYNQKRRFEKNKLESKVVVRMLHQVLQFLDPNEADELLLDDWVIDTQMLSILGFTSKFWFPNPERGSFHELLDKNKPTIVILWFWEDNLALAREIDKQWESNIIISDGIINSRVSRIRNTILVSKWIVYKDGKIFYCEDGNNKVSSDYVLSSYTWQGGTLPSRIPHVWLDTIEKYTENKEVTSQILMNNWINVAPYIAWKSPKSTQTDKKWIDIKYQEYNSWSISDSLKDFARKYWGNIVVKPTNGQWWSNVSFHNMNDNPNEAVLAIKRIIDSGSNVIVEKRIKSAPIIVEWEEMDWNFRVFVSKGDDNNFVVSDMEARIDSIGKPVNISISASVATYNQICEMRWISEDEKASLKADIESISLQACNAIEQHILQNEKPSHNRHQDFMWVDIIVEKTKDWYRLYVIEVNDQHSWWMWDLDNVVEWDEVGKSSRDLAKVMSRRARKNKQSKKLGVFREY